MSTVPRAVGTGAAPSVNLSAERVVAQTEWVETGHVRLRRRIVSETRVIEVVVRREELFVETSDIVGAGSDGLRWVGTRLDGPPVPAPDVRPPLTILLREEVPQVAMTTRVYERVGVHQQSATDFAPITVPVRHEEAVVETRRLSGEL